MPDRHDTFALASRAGAAAGEIGISSGCTAASFRGRLREAGMNCEEFELIALDLDQSGASSEERAAAREHLRNCARCAGLADSWEEARTELFLLGDNTRQAETPSRVEMRLRQEFRASRRPVVMRRRTATAAAWALAAAAVVAAGLTWNNWRQSRKEVAVRHEALIPAATDSSTENILLA